MATTTCGDALRQWATASGARLSLGEELHDLAITRLTENVLFRMNDPGWS